MNTLKLGGLVLAICLTILAIVYMFVSNMQLAVAGVQQGDEYQATTTTSTMSGTFDGLEVLKTGQGSLGTVIITGANTGGLVFFDATTTDITKRAASKATSSIAIAEIPVSLAAGTYVFDAEFTDGLTIVRLSGSGPTSTVTWR